MSHWLGTLQHDLVAALQYHAVAYTVPYEMPISFYMPCACMCRVLIYVQCFLARAEARPGVGQLITPLRELNEMTNVPAAHRPTSSILQQKGAGFV